MEKEHVCRVRAVEDFEENSITREERELDGKKYYATVGKLKGSEEKADETHCYPVSEWKQEDAQKECQKNKGIEFTPAENEDAKSSEPDNKPDEKKEGSAAKKREMIVNAAKHTGNSHIPSIVKGMEARAGKRAKI